MASSRPLTAGETSTRTSFARARRALVHRGPFNEAMTWLEIHGRAPEVLEHWKGFLEGTVLPQEGAGADQPQRRRRRRRGRRRRPPPAP